MKNGKKINGHNLPEHQFIHGDAKKVLDKLDKLKFRLIITSPPYNVNKEYETKKSIEIYLKQQEAIIEQLISFLEEDGSICWQVGNYIDPKTKEVFPLDIFYYDIFKNHGLILKNRIIWKFGHGYHAKTKFSGRYETILWFTKSNKYVFNLDDVRVPAKYPGKKHYKGPNKGKISGNPNGKNPSDVWTVLKEDWDREVWEIPNVKANHREKTGHPCQFPVELVERCVLALTNKNDWVLDPFSGVGTSVIASIKNGRNAIGIEKYKKYIKIGEERIQDLQNDKLKYRELGTPIFTPDPEKMAVAQKPDFFNY